MTPVFDPVGRLTNVTPGRLLDFCGTETSRLDLVRRALFRATPLVFETVEGYCDFVDAVGDVAGVHPHNIHIRGSCLLGFSTSPKPDKIWRKLDATRSGALSDIDVAVADVDLFARWCAEADAWDAANPISPKTGGTARAKFFDRQRQRRANCIASKSLSGSVCENEKRTLSLFDSTPYCGSRRSVTLLVFRDWRSLEARCVKDLSELWELRERLAAPPETLS